MTPSTQTIGVIGAGAIAQQHLQAISGDMAVTRVIVADTDPARLADVAQRYRVHQTVTDYKSILNDPSVDAVIVCLPHWLHAPVTLEALSAGKDVIVEKPIATTLEDARAMIAAADSKGKRLYVSLNQMFFPCHREAHRLVREGAIGRPFMMQMVCVGSAMVEFNEPDNWKGHPVKAGGGVLIDTGNHFNYLTLYHWGRPVAVRATGLQAAVTAGNKAEDTGSVILEYPDALVSHTLTYAAMGSFWQEYWHIVGTEGCIRGSHDNTAPLMLTTRHQTSVIELPALEPNWFTWTVGQSCLHALECLRTGAPFEVQPQQAVGALEMALAAYTSAQSGQRVLLD